MKKKYEAPEVELLSFETMDKQMNDPVIGGEDYSQQPF